MAKKDNFSQAAYEMFGIGKNSRQEPVEPVREPTPPQKKEYEPVVEQPVVKEVPTPRAPEKPKTTVLAEGTVFEGTLHAKGDVEIAGTFKGDVFSDGDVKLYANIEGNVDGGNVELVTSNVKGDVTTKGLLQVGPQSRIGGNVHTRDIICSGSIEGNVDAIGRATLASGSTLTGDLTAASLNVMEGAIMEGRFKIANKPANSKK